MRLVELFKEILHPRRIREMAAVGEIKDPKAGHYYLEVFSREYERETSHVTLEIPGHSKKVPVVKIKIPDEQPSIDDEPEFIWVRKNFTISSALKRAIQEWFLKLDDGQTGWWWASTFWKKQAQSVS